MLRLNHVDCLSGMAFILQKLQERRMYRQELDDWRKFLLVQAQMDADAAEARARLRLLEEQARNTRILKK